MTALPALLAVGLSLLNVFHSSKFDGWTIQCPRRPIGTFLIGGLPSSEITISLPLYETVLAFIINLGIKPELLLVVIPAGIYILVFCAGCLVRSYRAGIVSLVAASLFQYFLVVDHDLEQSFYSFLLLLILCLLLLTRRENTLKNSAMAGFAIGASLLTRSPLFLFPFVVLLCDRFFGVFRLKLFALRSLVFLAACYVLLVPWVFLNYSLTGKLTLLDGDRAADNVITAANGSIYTMEGDTYKAVGIAGDANVFTYFLNEVLKNPLSHALTILRRIWHIFLFQPILFSLLLIAVALGRGRDKAAALALPAYFVGIHSLLSIEARYFMPMAYLLPPFIVGMFFPARQDNAPQQCGIAKRYLLTAFWSVFVAVLAVEALLLAYPHRVARNAASDDALARAAQRFPHDSALQYMKCRELWRNGDDAGFYKCLGGYNRKFGNEIDAYVLSVIVSSSPLHSEFPPCGGGYPPCLMPRIIKMLGELKMGDQAAAAVSLRQAYSVYETGHNMLRGTPYEKDRELAARIKQDSSYFWTQYVYEGLLLWPPAQMAKILLGIEKWIVLPSRLAVVNAALKDKRFREKSGDIRIREWLARGASLAGPWGDGEEATTTWGATKPELRNMRAFQGGEAAPQALMALCVSLAEENKKEQALQACQSVVYAIDTGASGKAEGMRNLSSDASFESCKLLHSLGRYEEARETLAWTVKNAPPGWPGLAAAEVLLEKSR